MVKSVNGKGPTRRGFFAVAACGIGAAIVADTVGGAQTAFGLVRQGVEVVTKPVPASATVPLTSVTGKRLPQSIALYTPLWSDAEAVYVIDTIPTSDDHGVCRVVRYPKSNPQAQTSTDLGVFPLDAHNFGHRGASITTTDSGTVLAHPAIHNIEVGMTMKRSTQNRSIDQWTTVPPGNRTELASFYRRFFRDPYSGATYLIVRGQSWDIALFKWDEKRRMWHSVDRPNTGSAEGKVPQGLVGEEGIAPYGTEIAFARPTAHSHTIYCAPEFVVGAKNSDGHFPRAGFPRRDVSIMRSDDGGHTWRRPGASAITTDRFRPRMPNPKDSSQWIDGNVAVVFRGPSFDGSYPTTSRHNAGGARIGVTAANEPVIVSSWSDPEGNEPGTTTMADGSVVKGVPDSWRLRSVWAAWVNPDVDGDIVRTELLRPETDRHTGIPSLAYTTSGLIVVVVSAVFDTTKGDWTHIKTPPPAQYSPYPSDVPLYAFFSKDGKVWRRYLLHTGTQASDGSGDGISGAYIDSQALENERVLRIYPCFPGDPGRAEVWEYTDIPELHEIATPTPQAPDAPTASIVTTEGRNHVTWNLPSDHGAAVTSYGVYRKVSGDLLDPANFEGQYKVASAFAPGWIQNAAPGSTVSYKVVATSSIGSATSNIVTVTNTANQRPAAPEGATPQQWFRADAAPLGNYWAVGRWESTVPDATGVTRSAVAFSSDLRSNTTADYAPTKDARPRYIADGPNGFPALRFTRETSSQLVLEVPTSGDLTVLTVARLTDPDWSTLISHADSDGKMVKWGPHSRTNVTEHQTHYASEYFDGSNDVLTHHRVFSAHGTGPWKIFVSQWFVQKGRRRMGGQVNRCLVHQFYNENDRNGGAPWYTPIVPWDETFWPGEKDSHGNVISSRDPADVSDTEPVPTTAQYMTIGATMSTGGKQYNSAADIAEVIRFDSALSREQIATWVNYMLNVHHIALENGVPLDNGIADQTVGQSCIADPEYSNAPHGTCANTLKAVPYVKDH
ncbi:hypothetical protein [Rathayibacter toxicus]|uniref:hypothetical protein n=1 Tax=Rathayibacter toxicus TaxID=145458 RepID=UPI001C04CE74|nr:hypothetical protein [Rathayibacter toxicus]QWL31178.1 hypothetical protein E2R34_10785 [Rathayibacter toxicus]